MNKEKCPLFGLGSFKVKVGLRDRRSRETHRQEESLRRAGFEKFLPFFRIFAGKADGVEGVGKGGANEPRPTLQLENRRKKRSVDV